MQQNATGGIPGLGNIKRVVVLMFENRSFDHIFGALPGVDGLLLENGQINQDYYNLPNPLAPPSPGSPSIENQVVPPNLPVYPAPVDASIPMAHDFTHDFGDGMMPDLFGPTFTVSPAGAGPDTPYAAYTSGYVNGAPTGQTAPTQTYPEHNSGFYTTYNSNKQQEQSALTYFEDGVLQVLHTLAKSFVICDNWHCDMPGHTLPNRCFIHCGTTSGFGIDDPDTGPWGIISEGDSGPIYAPPNIAPTIFDRIAGTGAKWKMYAPGGNSGKLDLTFLNAAAQAQGASDLSDFTVDCKSGTLPLYSFIMCWQQAGTFTQWTDTSMHPQSLVQPGENLLAAVYNTLRQSPCWEDTLLVVTFDENGGIYDHKFPPGAVPPESGAPVATQSVRGCCGNGWTLNSQFDFSLLGLRVPALLISPWLSAGVDSTQYQNTSVIRFLVDMLNAQFPKADVPPLTNRDANAPEIESAFSQFGQSNMRQDCPGWIEPYQTLPSTDPNTNSNAIPYSDGTLATWSPPILTASAPPVAYTQELLSMYVAPLPGHPDSGMKITQNFPTNSDLALYVNERVQAAKKFYDARAGG